jgi:hypothetical protein
VPRRAEREQVLGRVPYQRRRSRAVLGRRPLQVTADHRDRDLVALALDQFGRRAQLVDDRHLGDLKFVAVRVDLAAVVEDRRDAGGAQGDVGQAGAPRAGPWCPR